MVTCPSCWTASLCWIEFIGLRLPLRPLSLVPHRVHECFVVRVGVLVASQTLYFLKGKTIALRKKISMILTVSLYTETSFTALCRDKYVDRCLNHANALNTSPQKNSILSHEVVLTLHRNVQLPTVCVCANDQNVNTHALYK